MKLSTLCLLLLSGCLLLVLPACMDGLARQSSSDMIPPLLDRVAGLGDANEQARVHNLYQDLSQEITAHPKSVTAKLKLARLFMLEARTTGEHGYYFPAALEVLGSIDLDKVRSEEKLEVVFLQSSVHLSLHQFDEALVLAERAYTLNPRLQAVYGALVDSYVEMGQYEPAVEKADEMVALRPDLRSYSRVSYLREIYGEVEGAITAMKMAISAGASGQEDVAWCGTTLGQIFETYGKLDQARLAYEMVLQSRADYPFAIAGLASIAQKEGNLSQAESLLKQACELIPEVSFYEQLASLYQQQGKTQLAAETSQSILEMLADDEAHGHLMGMSYALVYLDLLGEPSQALSYIRPEYAMRPNNIDVNRIMAEVYAAEGDWEQAKPHVEKAQQTGSRLPRLLCVAGLVEIHTGNPSLGKQLLQEAFATDPYQSHHLVAEAQTWLP